MIETIPSQFDWWTGNPRCRAAAGIQLCIVVLSGLPDGAEPVSRCVVSVIDISFSGTLINEHMAVDIDFANRITILCWFPYFR